MSHLARVCHMGFTHPLLVRLCRLWLFVWGEKEVPILIPILVRNGCLLGTIFWHVGPPKETQAYP